MMKMKINKCGGEIFLEIINPHPMKLIPRNEILRNHISRS